MTKNNITKEIEAIEEYCVLLEKANRLLINENKSINSPIIEDIIIKTKHLVNKYDVVSELLKKGLNKMWNKLNKIREALQLIL